MQSPIKETCRAVSQQPRWVSKVYSSACHAPCHHAALEVPTSHQIGVPHSAHYRRLLQVDGQLQAVQLCHHNRAPERGKLLLQGRLLGAPYPCLRPRSPPTSCKSRMTDSGSSRSLADGLASVREADNRQRTQMGSCVLNVVGSATATPSSATSPWPHTVGDQHFHCHIGLAPLAQINAAKRALYRIPRCHRIIRVS